MPPPNYFEITAEIKLLITKKLLNEFIPEFLQNELRSYLFNHFGIVASSFTQELLNDIVNKYNIRSAISGSVIRLSHNIAFELIAAKLIKENAVPFIEIEKTEWTGLFDPKIYQFDQKKYNRSIYND